MTTQQILQGVHDWTNGKIVYDISVAHPDEQGNPTPYANLTAALGTGGANIPESLRKGGMSVKFVQSSDNKYVQYRLMSDAWSTDTNNWAIADEGAYVENPEFVYVKTDNEGKILWAIKTDGGIYYGAGVPQQVIDYIDAKLAEFYLDEYEDIVAFLADLEKGDKTLQELLDKKVDGEYVENPEFVYVKTDAEDKIIEGIKADGTRQINTVGDIWTKAYKFNKTSFSSEILYERYGEGMIFQIQLIGPSTRSTTVGINENFASWILSVYTDENLFFQGTIFSLCGMGLNITNNEAPIYNDIFFYTPLFSKTGTRSSIILNYKIPYYKHVKVVLINPDPENYSGFGRWTIVKDTSSINIEYGGYKIPYGAYLHSDRIINTNVPAGDMVDLINTNKNVFVLSEMFSAEGSERLQEGCVRLFKYGMNEIYTLISTGMEDYFCFCHYFDVGMRQTPMCGCTYFKTYTEDNLRKVKVCAYRIHIDDPLIFKEGGARLTVRNGDQNTGQMDLHSINGFEGGVENAAPMNFEGQSTYYTW